jgi:hypothetical protein
MIVGEESMVRITRDGDLPLHYEASPLRAVIGAVGWPAAIVAIVAGIAAFVKAGSGIAEAAAALLVLIGCLLVVVLVRCRRYEVTVGKRMIELRLGPFRRTLPAGCVTDAAERPVSSWRRYYAPREMVLTLSVETRPVIIPTHDVDELRAVLLGRPKGDGSSTI